MSGDSKKPRRLPVLQLLIVVGGILQGASVLLPHSKFELRDGLVRLVERPVLHVTVKGDGIAAGGPLVLRPTSAHDHELFEPPTAEEGLVRVSKTDGLDALCLQASRAAVVGASLVVWPCAEGGRLHANEQFMLDPVSGQLRMRREPGLCVNVKGGGLGHGAELILWHCGRGDAAGINERFAFVGGRIALLANTSWHFNIAGGQLKANASVVMWDFQPGHLEAFEFLQDGRLHLAANKAMCMNAEGGLGQGHRLILWPCHEQPSDNELFEEDTSKRAILATRNKKFAFNAAGGGMQPDDEVVLWPWDEERDEL